MGFNLILKFKLRRGEAAQVRRARCIRFDGNGGLIIVDPDNAASERLLLCRVRDLRIQSLPVWTGGLESRA
jgi:hypothetical protein